MGPVDSSGSAPARPDAYQAEGVLHIAGKFVALEDAGGLRLPFALLLCELAGRRVRIHIEPLEPGEAGP